MIHAFGPPEVPPEQVRDPVPGPGQVSIAVEVAGAQPGDGGGAAGDPGNGVGGYVTAVGQGVDGRLHGQQMVASLTGTGGYAEIAVADGAAPIEIPSRVGTADAVALLADGRTAIMLVRGAEPGAGEAVLVEAATGGWVVCWSSSRARPVPGWWARRGARTLALARALGASPLLD